MPELPEVETVRRGVERHVVGVTVREVVVRDHRLRKPVVSADLQHHVTAKAVLAVRRRAKYLLFEMEAGGVLLVHLGMSGKLGLVPSDKPFAKHDHVVLRLDDGWDLRFNDSRRFGLVLAFSEDEMETHPCLRDLGVEPLGPHFDAATLHRQTRKLSKPVKNFLMDAHYLVGVGNIYACEALHRAGVHPARRVSRISLAQWQSIVHSVKTVLTEAIAKGGTTLRDYVRPNGEAGYFAIELAVYGREGELCRDCGTTIRRIVQAGRSTFYCFHCQPSRGVSGTAIRK